MLADGGVSSSGGGGDWCWLSPLSPSYLGPRLSGLGRRVALHKLIVLHHHDALCRSGVVLVLRRALCGGVVREHWRWRRLVKALRAGVSRVTA